MINNESIKSSAANAGLREKRQRVKRVLIWALLTLTALASILFTRRYMYLHVNGLDVPRDEQAFEEMYFPVLDRIYENGDFTELQAEIRRLSLQEGAAAISRWPHISSLQYYTQGTLVDYARTVLADGNDGLQELSSGIWAALTILYKNDDFENNEKFSETDRERIRGYVEQSTQLLEQDLGLTSEQIQDLYEACLYENGEVEYDKVVEYVRIYYENGRVFTIP